MRLLFVSHSLPPDGRPLANVGGMQRVAQKLHESLDAKAADTDALDYESLLLRSAWRTLHAKVPFFLAKAGWKIGRAAQNDAVDVVLFSSMVTASLAVPLQGLFRRHGVKTAAIVHGLDVTTPFPPYQWFVPKVFAALDAVFPVSRATQQACLDRGAAPNMLRVVPNGIDTDRFQPPQDPASDRQALEQRVGAAPPPPPDGLLLCSAGRQVKRKGTAWFVDTVMPRLPDDVHYWIAGDGPQSSAIRDAIDRLDRSSRVRHLGRIPNDTLADLYRGADLFIMPNVPVEDDMEGFGIVLLEAGQCGTPAIAARLEGIQDVITDGVNGHLVAPEDPNAFAAAIELYRGNPEALATAAQQARQHTEATFGWPAVTDAYLSVLDALHANSRPAPNEQTLADAVVPGSE